ncbi:MAG: XkdX family protein [Oscillospiraceae bacterium]|nr:XkdX family protein [Oscillospiraceae bacterium]
MNEIWANRLAAGTQLWSDVPFTRKSGVKTVLKSFVASGVISSEEYESITGEEYEAL